MTEATQTSSVAVRKKTDLSASHIVIQASAGTGKTFQLTHRFIRLLAAEVPAEQILATTFTRKAAAEILGRVLLRLASACESRESREELERAIGRGVSEARALKLLETISRNLHRLQICTLDSFLFRIVSSFSLELGLRPDWHLADDAAVERHRREAVSRMLEAADAHHIAELLRHVGKGGSKRQVHAEVENTAEDLYRLFIESGPQAWNWNQHRILLPRRTLETAIAELESMPEGDIPSRQHKATRSDVAKARERDWESFLRRGLAPKILRGEQYYRKDIDALLRQAYRPLIQHAMADIGGKLAARTKALRELLQAYDETYRARHEETGALSFEDLTRVVLSGDLGDRLDEIYYRIDGRVAHILLDEFQDTSLSQWQVLSPIVDEICAHGDDSRTFFCVGDTKQAIYGWRGGSADILRAVSQRENVSSQPLDCSYRSSPPIIDTVNKVFTRLAESRAVKDERRDAVAAWQSQFKLHSTAKTDQPGHVQVQVAPRAEKHSKQIRTNLAYAAEWIANQAPAMPQAHFGVLVRDNEAVSQMILELRSRGIDASEEGGVRITNSPAVVCVLELLRLADHPGDRIALHHVATSPLGPVVGLARNVTSQRYPEGVARRLASRVRRQLLEDGYGATISGWRQALAGVCDARERNRLAKLVEIAHAYHAQTNLRPEEFVRLAEAKKVEDPSASQVRVMTLHQSKGLEFEVVVLPHLDRDMHGRAPAVLTSRPAAAAPVERVCAYLSQEIADHFDELKPLMESYRHDVVEDPLSLFYVGLTRATHALYAVIAPPSRSEKEKIPFTYGGMLRATLAATHDGSPESIPYECGDPEWYARFLELRREQNPEDGRDPEPVLLRSPRLAQRTGRTRRLGSERPSELEGSGPSGDQAIGDRLRLSRSQVMLRGTFLHHCFEAVSWVEDGAPTKDFYATLARRLRLGHRDRDRYVREFKGSLEREAIRALLSVSGLPGGDRSSVRLERELGFAVRRDDRIVQGTFDRVVLHIAADGTYSALEIVDFKTDRFDDGDAERLMTLTDLYRPQLRAYREAASALFKIPESSVTARLAFVAAGIVVEV